MAEKGFGSLRAPVARVGASDVAIPAGDGALRVLPGVVSLARAVRHTLGVAPRPVGAGA